MSGLSLNFISPGPVTDAFLACEEPVQALLGPIGGGKTTSNFYKHIINATRAKVSPLDGRRRYRLGVVRSTYRELWSTTIPSWWKQVPPDTGTWTGGTDQPAVHRILFNDGRGVIEFEVWFRAIGEQAVEAALRGMEVTAWYLNEADLLAEDVLTYCKSRLGRYPDMSHGGPAWSGVTMDFNAPDTENYLYKLLVEDKKEGDGNRLFTQPSGLDPRAENLANLPPGYYADRARGQPDWWVRRFIINQWGYSRSGTPVYPEFNDQLHVAAEDLKPIEGRPLILGIDTALHPAMMIEQQMPDTQWRWLRELYCPGMGPTRFAEATLQVLNDFAPWHMRRAADGMVVGHVDPSAQYGGDGEDGAWLDIFRAKTHLLLRPAPTNKFAPRRDVLIKPLTTMIDGKTPGFQMSPRACPLSRGGMNARYRYKDRRLLGGTTMIGDDVEKNDASHPIEAGQYAMLGGGAYYELTQRADHLRRRLTQTQAEMD